MSLSRGILHTEGRGRHLPFLIALVVMFLLYPAMAELGLLRWYRLAFAALLLVAVYSLGGTRRHLLVGLALGVPAVLAQLVVVASASRWTVAVGSALGLVFLGYILLVTFASVLSKGKVTWDKIFGAIAIYLLLGLMWAIAYGVLATLDPAAFQATAALEDRLRAGTAGGTDYAFIYYSFVTLTTLGYGDITPVEPIGQALAWMEAATGQLFLAVTIARLVGLAAAEGTE